MHMIRRRDGQIKSARRRRSLRRLLNVHNAVYGTCVQIGDVKEFTALRVNRGADTHLIRKKLYSES
jgi:hypothetical protein